MTGNGEVIVASYRSVGLYDSAGNVRTLVDLNALGYNTSEYSVEQIALSPDGASVWVALGGCFKSPVFLVASLADGSVFRSPLSDRSYNSYMNFVTGMVVGTPVAVPALGPLALSLLAVALAAVGAAIIRIR